MSLFSNRLFLSSISRSLALYNNSLAFFLSCISGPNRIVSSNNVKLCMIQLPKSLLRKRHE